MASFGELFKIRRDPEERLKAETARFVRMGKQFIDKYELTTHLHLNTTDRALLDACCAVQLFQQQMINDRDTFMSYDERAVRGFSTHSLLFIDPVASARRRYSEAQPILQALEGEFKQLIADNYTTEDMDRARTIQRAIRMLFYEARSRAAIDTRSVDPIREVLSSWSQEWRQRIHQSPQA